MCIYVCFVREHVHLCMQCIILFVASVNNLISNSPYDEINVNNIADNYIGIFSTSRALTDVSYTYIHTCSS